MVLTKKILKHINKKTKKTLNDHDYISVRFKIWCIAGAVDIIFLLIFDFFAEVI